MLHACDQKFDVTENLENFCKLNKVSALLYCCTSSVCTLLTLNAGSGF